MAKIGELVAKIQLDTKDAIKNADDFKKVLKDSQASLRDLDKIQTKTTKTQENYTAQLEIVKDTLAFLDKEFKEVSDSLSTYEETTKKANLEAGQSEELTKKQVKEYQNLQKQFTDISKGIQKMRVEEVSLTRAKEELARTTDLQAQKEADLELKRESNAQKEEQRIKEQNRLHKEQIELDKQREQRQTEQYAREVQDRRLDARETQVDFIGGVGRGLSSASDSVTSGIMKTFNAYQDYETVVADIMRLAKGDDSQNQELIDSIKTLMVSNHEDNSLIADVIGQVVTSVDPDQYGGVLQGVVQNVLDLVLATGLEQETAANAIISVVRATGSDITDAANLFSGFNAIENVKQGVNTAHAVETATTAAVPLLNANFSWDEIVAWTSMNSIATQKGAGSDATAIIELADTISKYNDKTEVAVEFLRGMNLTLDDYLLLGEGAVFDTESSKSFLEKHKLTKADVTKSLDDMQLSEDLQKALDLNSQQAVHEWMQENGMLKGLVELSQYFNDLVTEDQSYASVVADRKYLSGNSNFNIAMQNLSTFSDVDEFTDLATTGNKEGTSLTDEANTLRETSASQIELFYKQLQMDLIEIGEELAPILMDFLPILSDIKDFFIDIVKAISQLPPDVLKSLILTNVGVKAGGMALSGVGSVFGMVNQLKQFQVANEVLKSTKGALPAINAMNKGQSVLAGVDGLGEAIEGLNKSSASATKGINSASSTLVGTMGVGGSVMLTLAAAAAVAAGLFYLDSEMTKADKQNRGWQREGSENISQDVRDSVGEVNNAGRNANYLVTNALNSGNLDDLDVDVTSLSETADTMVGKINEHIQAKIKSYQSLTIDTSQEQGELTDISNRAKELQDQINTLVQEIAEGNAEDLETKLKELQSLQEQLDIVYAEAFGATADEAKTIAEELQRNRLGENLSYGEKVERIGGINESIQSASDTHEFNSQVLKNKLSDLDNQYNEGSISQIDYVTKTALIASEQKRIDDLLKDEVASLIAESSYLRNTMSAYQQMKYLTTSEGRELRGYEKEFEYYGDVSRMGDIYREGQHASVMVTEGLSDEQIALVERYNEAIYQLINTSDGLDTVSADTFNAALAYEFMGEEGINSLITLKDTLGETLPPTFLTDAQEEMGNYLDTLDVAEQQSLQGLQLQVWSNIDEETIDLITLNDMWNNETFLQRVLEFNMNKDQVNQEIQNVKANADNLTNTNYTLTVDSNLDSQVSKTKTLIEWIKSIPRNITTTITQKVAGFFGYAEGTNFHPGGYAWLGDGYEPELVLEPGKKPWITPSQPFLHDLARGATVIPQHDWSKYNLPNLGYPKYADGVGQILNTNNESSSYEVTVNAYASNVDVPLIKREIERTLGDIELNKSRTKKSGGES